MSIKLDQLKRTNRRKQLLKKLVTKLPRLSKEAFFGQEENDVFHKKVIVCLDQASLYKQFEEKNDKENFKLSINFIKKIPINELTFEKPLLAFFTGNEVEFIQIGLKEVFDNLLFLSDLNEFHSGKGDFILVEQNMTKGLSVEITEYQIEVYVWGDVFKK